MSSLIIQLVTSVCGSLVSLLVFSLITVLQHLPQITESIRMLFEGILSVSRGIYQKMLAFVSQHFKVDLLCNPWRTIAILVLSIILGITVSYLFYQVTFQQWVVIAFIIHGLLVSTTWRENKQKQGFRLGVDF